MWQNLDDLEISKLKKAYGEVAETDYLVSSKLKKYWQQDGRNG